MNDIENKERNKNKAGLIEGIKKPKKLAKKDGSVLKKKKTFSFRVS